MDCFYRLWYDMLIYWKLAYISWAVNWKIFCLVIPNVFFHTANSICTVSMYVLSQVYTFKNIQVPTVKSIPMNFHSQVSLVMFSPCIYNESAPAANRKVCGWGARMVNALLERTLKITHIEKYSKCIYHFCVCSKLTYYLIMLCQNKNYLIHLLIMEIMCNIF